MWNKRESWSAVKRDLVEAGEKVDEVYSAAISLILEGNLFGETEAMNTPYCGTSQLHIIRLLCSFIALQHNFYLQGDGR